MWLTMFPTLFSMKTVWYTNGCVNICHNIFYFCNIILISLHLKTNKQTYFTVFKIDKANKIKKEAYQPKAQCDTKRTSKVDSSIDFCKM